MEKRKIAVCISGQIRTAIEAVSNFNLFFQDEDIDVFIHTWYDPSLEDHENVINQIKTLYKPKKFQIDISPNTNRLNFEVMLKTIMLSNELKRKYEVENDIRYDVVVKYRFDILFPQITKFTVNNIEPRTLYYPQGNNGVQHTDYNNHGMTDVIFWGDSQTMDIACDTYRYYKFVLLPIRNTFVEKTGHIVYDMSESLMSPGQIIFKYATKHNIFPMVLKKDDNNFMNFTLWRKEVKNLNWINDFDKIEHFYLNQYND
jgi:hypothetical protein